MKVAIIGSKSLDFDISDYIPNRVTEIISGGAKGIDVRAKNYAIKHNIRFVELLPEYEKYGKSAPFKRNAQIVDRADMVIAFWDGLSRGTKFAIDYAREKEKFILIF